MKRSEQQVTTIVAEFAKNSDGACLRDRKMLHLPLQSLVLLFVALVLPAWAEPPAASYIFPAGAQRGTDIEARVGGLYFHGQADFHLLDSEGLTASPVVKQVETTWFEGPLIFQPDSQKGEDYPKDHRVTVAIDGKTSPGIREWYCQTDQGTTSNLKFVIGEYPEIIEKEIDGEPVPDKVASLPVTINGRIFPREDVDLWEFDAETNQAIVCEVASVQLGYPLEPVLDVMGPDGGVISVERRIMRGDTGVAFVAPASGAYRVRIRDANFWGLQNYVYRLTIRTGHLVTGYFPLGGDAGKTVEVAVSTNDGKVTRVPVLMPAKSGMVPVRIEGHTATLPFHVSEPGQRIFDGQIAEAGKVDSYPLDLTEGESIVAEIFAHEFDSRLDSLVTIEDAEGRQLLQNDDREDKVPDSRAVFTAKKAGRYFVKVGDKFSSRGGPGFAYRLRIGPGPEPIDFDLIIADTPINVRRMSRAETALEELPKPVRGTGLAVNLVPFGALKKDIELSVEGLPGGIELEGAKLSYRRKKTEIFFRVNPDVELGTRQVELVGTVDLGEGKTLVRKAKVPVRFTVAPTVPFKHVGQYWITNDHPCGSVLVKRYQVERLDGFNGAIRAMLADRQIRHLQGVTAPVVEIPPGKSEFAFPITFPPRMELGRTSRVQLMLVGEVDGKTVSFTTRERNEQMITITTDGLLSLSGGRSTFAVAPGKTIGIPVSIRRAPSIGNLSVRVEADVPSHFRGVSAEPVEIPGGKHNGIVEVHFSSEATGPFNMPLRFLATAQRGADDPVTAQALIELVTVR